MGPRNPGSKSALKKKGPSPRSLTASTWVANVGPCVINREVVGNQASNKGAKSKMPMARAILIVTTTCSVKRSCLGNAFCQFLSVVTKLPDWVALAPGDSLLTEDGLCHHRV